MLLRPWLHSGRVCLRPGPRPGTLRRPRCCSRRGDGCSRRVWFRRPLKSSRRACGSTPPSARWPTWPIARRRWVAPPAPGSTGARPPIRCRATTAAASRRWPERPSWRRSCPACRSRSPPDVAGARRGRAGWRAPGRRQLWVFRCRSIRATTSCYVSAPEREPRRFDVILVENESRVLVVEPGPRLASPARPVAGCRFPATSDRCQTGRPGRPGPGAAGARRTGDGVLAGPAAGPRLDRARGGRRRRRAAASLRAAGARRPRRRFVAVPAAGRAHPLLVERPASRSTATAAARCWPTWGWSAGAAAAGTAAYSAGPPAHVRGAPPGAAVGGPLPGGGEVQVVGQLLDRWPRRAAGAGRGLLGDPVRARSLHGPQPVPGQLRLRRGLPVGWLLRAGSALARCDRAYPDDLLDRRAPATATPSCSAA